MWLLVQVVRMNLLLIHLKNLMRSHKTWLASKYRITNNNKNIEQIDSMPCIILSTLHTVTCLMLTILLWGWYYCYLHFTDEESEAKSSRNLTSHIASKCWHQDSNSAGLAPEFMFITVNAILHLGVNEHLLVASKIIQDVYYQSSNLKESRTGDNGFDDLLLLIRIQGSNVFYGKTRSIF